MPTTYKYYMILIMIKCNDLTNIGHMRHASNISNMMLTS